MKATLLITSLQLLYVLVNGQGGLRTVGNENVEGDSSFQLLLDSEDNHRHELERRPHHPLSNDLSLQLLIDSEDNHRYELETHHHHHQEHLIVDTHRNLTSTNQMLPAGNVGSRDGQGTMFYVKTKRDVRITGFDIYSQTASDSDPVQVYTRRGKYNGYVHSSDGWELVYQNGATRLLGSGSTPTHLSISSVTIPANTFQSFFIWTKNNSIKYRTGTFEGNVWSNDNNLILYEGIGKSTKFGGNNNNVERPRIFRGSIKYDEINSNNNVNVNANANRGAAIDPLSVGGFSKSSRIACPSNQVRVSMEVKTDQYGEQTSWSMRKKGTTQLLYAGPDATNNYSYKSRTSYSGTMCVDVGMYEFKVEDTFNDGMCCSAGQGYYNIDVETKDGTWRKAVRGSNFLGSKVHVVGKSMVFMLCLIFCQMLHHFKSIILIYFQLSNSCCAIKDIGEQESMMTERDHMYLESHNRRRIDWHARYNKEYIPLKWSKGKYFQV